MPVPPLRADAHATEKDAVVGEREAKHLRWLDEQVRFLRDQHRETAEPASDQEQRRQMIAERARLAMDARRHTSTPWQRPTADRNGRADLAKPRDGEQLDQPLNDADE
ncbi:MAG: hypothetical protein ABI652_07075 [Acidobacteriota bacterium]